MTNQLLSKMKSYWPATPFETDKTNEPTKITEPYTRLRTTEPYHIPGYGGYCGQLKYRFGKTYGSETSNLLADKRVAASNRQVLVDYTLPANPRISDRIDPGSEQKVELLDTRTQSYGQQIYVKDMVPGYTGYIPKTQHHFAKRYGQHCINALSDFEASQRQYRNKYQNTKKDAELTFNCHKPLYGPDYSVHPQIQKEYTYVPKHSKPTYPISPYSMSNCDPEKYFMPGYTGFVPRTREQFGSVYADTTNKGLCDFADEYTKMETISKYPVQIHRPPRPKSKTLTIYPQKCGLVPHYTGHVPGEKFRFGQTYGHSTANSIGKKLLAASVI